MLKRFLSRLAIGIVLGGAVFANNIIGQKQEYRQTYTDFTGNELTTADWAYGIISGSIADQTFQDVVDNSIAQDGEVFVEYGASLFEDDGGSSSSQIKIGGYEWEIRDQAADTTIIIRSPTTYSSEDGYMEFVDDRANAVGLQYRDDYCATLTGNSLIHKSCVEGLITGAALKSGNLVTINGNNEIDLGGTATDDVSLGGNGGEMEIRDWGHIFTDDVNDIDINATNGVNINNGENSINFGSNGISVVTDNTKKLELTSNSAGRAFDIDVRDVETVSLATTGDGKVTFTNSGWTYDQDYSGYNTSNNRRLADKGYVDNSISAIPVTNIYTANGTLTANRTINGFGKSMTLTNTSDTILDSNHDTNVSAGHNVRLSASHWVAGAVGNTSLIIASGHASISNDIFGLGFNENEFYVGDFTWNNGIHLSKNSYILNIEGTGGVNIESPTKVDMQVPSLVANQRVLLMSGIGAIGNTDVNFQARDSYGALMNGGSYGAYVGYGFGTVPLISTNDVYIGANTEVHIDAPVTNMTGDVIFRDELKLTKTASGAVWQTLSGSTWVDFKTREF